MEVRFIVHCPTRVRFSHKLIDNFQLANTTNLITLFSIVFNIHRIQVKLQFFIFYSETKLALAFLVFFLDKLFNSAFEFYPFLVFKKLPRDINIYIACPHVYCADDCLIQF
ncbi:hypothetical protein RF11_02060 [Thelohanellus kitauei]|uniref:Uncharacterized protein n=1 Tax=Thelohanellus kitauei TaxID=669202 RepID=A0A0C2MGW9_THEKT|nr:hypothetical protein RF11_02060 [Thelohanellus kitauei]